MVMTRRASLLERQRGESLAPINQSDIDTEVEVEVETDVKPQSISRDSPSLLRSTPQLEQPEVKTAPEDDIVGALSAITISIKDEPVDLDDTAVMTSALSAVSIDLGSPIPVVKTEVVEIGSEDEDEEEARDIVGAMRNVRALPVRARRTSSAGSVVSVEDAKVSIDE
jgi:hypothetical protein